MVVVVVTIVMAGRVPFSSKYCSNDDLMPTFPARLLCLLIEYPDTPVFIVFFICITVF